MGVRTAGDEGDSTLPRERGRTRSMGKVHALEALVGAHPEALADLYASGELPGELADLEARGRLLAIAGFSGVHALMRGAFANFARAFPCRGQSFSASGTEGSHVLFGRARTRFRCEPGASQLDARDTLVLRHDGLGNSWPASEFVCELRRVGERAVIGPCFRRRKNGEPRLAFWWGLEA